MILSLVRRLLSASCPSRERHPLSARRLLVLLVALPLLLGWATTRAQGTERLATSSPAPLAGSGSVVFISQAVDATLVRNPSGSYRADNKAVIRLHNSSREADTTVTFGWPGWPGGDLTFNPTLGGDFTVYLADGTPLPTRAEAHSTAWGGESRDSTWIVTDTTIARDQRQRIFFDWVQPLGSGPLITYDFGLIPASAWRDPVGSARVTLSLPTLSSEEIIVRATPSDYSFDGQRIEWLLVDQEPSVNPSVTLIAPHLWQEIEQARAAATTDPFGANLHLAELYDALAGAGLSEYGNEAVAALEAARRAQPDNPEPLRRLANRYRQEAEQRGGDLALLEQAATAAEAAFAVGLDDPVLRDDLVRDLQTLAEAWLLRDPRVALDFLARAEAASPDPAALAERRASAAQGIALAALQRGDLDEARSIAAEYGLPLDFAPLPWLESATVRIDNGPTERRTTFTPIGDPDTVSEKMNRYIEQATANGIAAEWDGSDLTIRLPGPSDSWTAAGMAAAEHLGDEAEWDLLRDALHPRLLQYLTIEEPVERLFGYREQLHIETRAGTNAELLRQEAATRDSRWERALLEVAAQRWQALYESQRMRVVTTFDSGSGPITREWSVTVPSDERLEWIGSLPRRDRWLQIGGMGALVLLALLALIWLPASRRD